jgi:hypothetical protein
MQNRKELGQEGHDRSKKTTGKKGVEKRDAAGANFYNLIIFTKISSFHIDSVGGVSHRFDSVKVKLHLTLT